MGSLTWKKLDNLRPVLNMTLSSIWGKQEEMTLANWVLIWRECLPVKGREKKTTFLGTS